MSTWIDDKGAFVARVLEILRLIEAGYLKIRAAERRAAERVHCGAATYHVAGWTLGVFNDCDEWDYLEFARSPEGEQMDFGDMPEFLKEWRPELVGAHARWGLEP